MIKATELININPRDYKLHLATISKDGINPIDVFIRDKNEWEAWQSYRGKKNEWNRNFIFTLIKYHNRWLFGGIFKVIKRHQDNYEVSLTDELQGLIGRLVISGIPSQRGRGRSYKLERYFDRFEINEILQNAYDGQDFPGYENINISFNMLKHIYNIQKADWKSSLSNLKGVYLINDTYTNKKYIGSAYGDTGIWTRWNSYIDNGHGGNKLLKKLISENSLEYAEKYFKFSLLEFRSMKTEDREIIAKESFWKDVLNTRGNFGYNEN